MAEASRDTQMEDQQNHNTIEEEAPKASKKTRSKSKGKTTQKAKEEDPIQILGELIEKSRQDPEFTRKLAKVEEHVILLKARLQEKEREDAKMNEILQEIKKISTFNPSMRTYPQTTSNNTLLYSQALANNNNKPKLMNNMESRILQCRITDEEKRKELVEKPSGEVASLIRECGGVWAKTTSIRVTDKNIQILAPDTQTLGEMAGEAGRLSRVLGQTHVTRKTYPIQVHSVSREYGKVIPEETIKQWQHQNRSTYPNMHITKVRWKKWDETNRDNKTHGTLIIDVTLPEAAKSLVEKGSFVIDDVFHITEQWDNQWSLTACYNCQGYGHIAKHCKRASKCGKCSGNHSTRDCTSKETKCSNCEGKHASWEAACTKRKQIKSLIASLMARGAEYMRHLVTPCLPTLQPFSNRKRSIGEGSGREARPRGRPPGSPNKAKNIIPDSDQRSIFENFTLLTPTQNE
jgi:hypothetical protein